MSSWISIQGTYGNIVLFSLWLPGINFPFDLHCSKARKWVWRWYFFITLSAISCARLDADLIPGRVVQKAARKLTCGIDPDTTALETACVVACFASAETCSVTSAGDTFLCGGVSPATGWTQWTPTVVFMIFALYIFYINQNSGSTRAYLHCTKIWSACLLNIAHG